MMDWDLGDRLLNAYFDLAQRDQALDLETRFSLLVAADDYRFIQQSTMGDPHGAYFARVAALESYKAGPVKHLSKFSGARNVWKYKESLFRQMAGVDAVNAGQLGQAVEQLNLLKLSWDGTDPVIAMNIMELEQLLHWYRRDYEAALTNMRAYTKMYPLMVNRVPAVKNVFLMGEAQYLTGLGEWDEAYETLVEIQRGSTSRLVEEYRIGYLTLIEAHLGRRPSMLEEFTAAEPSFREQRRGIQAGIGYYGISTTVFWQLASQNGNTNDLKRAITSGRNMGEALRKNKYHDKSPTSPLPASAMEEAKQAYAKAAIQGIDKNVSNDDDLLNAVQILQMSETDRDIAAMTLRLSNILNIKPEKLRTLQDLQRRVWASQNKLVSFTMASNAGSVDDQSVYREFQESSHAYNKLLTEISREQPLINQLLTSPEAIKLNDVQRHLSAGEALLV